jgi:hypothetical protein
MNGKKEYPTSPSRDVVFVFILTRLSQFCRDTECDRCRALAACLRWHTRLSGSSARKPLTPTTGQKYLRIFYRDVVKARRQKGVIAE